MTEDVPYLRRQQRIMKASVAERRAGASVWVGEREGEGGARVQENCGLGGSGAAAAAPEQSRCFDSGVRGCLDGNA